MTSPEHYSPVSSELVEEMLAECKAACKLALGNSRFKDDAVTIEVMRSILTELLSLRERNAELVVNLFG